MGKLSLQTIAAITEIVTGGSANSSLQPISAYRSGPLLERFFGALNFKFSISGGSRVPTVREFLAALNEEDDGLDKIAKVVEQVVDPREYIDDPARLDAVVGYLNKRLRLDGFELRMVGQRHRVVAIATISQATSALRQAATVLDLDSVHRDSDRALAQADQDPEDAITAACSTVESLCKCLLDEMGQPYPAKQDIAALVREVQNHLDLSPGRDDLSPDIKQILGGLSNVTSGIGALRTHAGDAHGKGKRVIRVDGRIARLAIHSASTVSLFFIETWQKRRKP